jgi:hypothetical protein
MMAISKGKAEGGQGGKRGHSNMDHWEFTEEIKLAAKKRRRLAAKLRLSSAGSNLKMKMNRSIRELT